MKEKHTHQDIKSQMGMVGDYLYGWAYNAADLHAKLVLEIYCDHYSIGCVIADAFEQCLADQKMGDACYGFVFKLPEYTLRKNKKIQLRIANTSEWLSDTLVLAGECDSLNKDLLSQVYAQGGLFISGWAWKPSQPKKTLSISVFIEHEELLTTSADRFIPYVDGDQAYHGFEIQLPAKLADGKKHTLRLLDDEGDELNGSPVTVIESMDNAQQLIEQSKNNPAAQKLLETLLANYQKYVPRAIGIQHYAQWYNVFGQLKKIPCTSQQQLGILIFGNHNKQKTLHSLQQQNYPHWQIIDLKQKVIHAEIHYIMPIQAGDHLPQYSLLHIVETLEKHHPALLYTDCDQDNQWGERSQPYFKPDWNYEYFCSFNYIQSAWVVRANLINMEDNCDSLHLLYQSIAKSLCLDLLGNTIIHLAKIAYHRAYQASNTPKTISNTQQQTVLQGFLDQMETGAIAYPQPSHPDTFRIIRPLKQQPLVSLIIPTRDKVTLLDACLNSIIEKTTYSNIEIIVVNNRSVEQKTFDCLKKYRKKGIRVLDYDETFNYSAINNFAVKYAKGDVIGLINNDIEVISPDWIEEMLGLLLRPHIGAVGAKLLWPNEMVQHGGVILGVGGLASHYGNYLHNDDAGYMQRNQVSQQVSAVTAACLLVKKENYWAVGGLNEYDFPVAFNDVDFCLKLSEKGLKNIWSAHAKLYHFESASRGKEDNPIKVSRAYREQQNLKQAWRHRLSCDPSYNDNFSLSNIINVFTGLKF